MQQSSDDQQYPPPRSEHFEKEYEPFRNNVALQINDEEVTGPIAFFNPTRAGFTYTGSVVHKVDSQGSEFVAQEGEVESEDGVLATRVEYAWSSRNNRKGRHALAIHEYYPNRAGNEKKSSSPLTGRQAIGSGIWRMLTSFPWYDVSWVNAMGFFTGCLALLVNAFLSFLPYAKPDLGQPSWIIYVEASLTLIGSGFFAFSSFLGFGEAVNAQRRGCFGWKAEQISFADQMDTSVEEGAVTRLVPVGTCEHHHSRESHTFSYEATSSQADGEPADRQQLAITQPVPVDIWRWLPTKHALRNHLVYEIGFLASAVLFGSSLVYCAASIATFVTSIMSESIPHWIRIPQIIGATGFILASICLMIENQTYWTIPEPRSIGWNINCCIMVGSIGLLLSAIFGLLEPADWASYQWAGI
ncbi:uncharacterized protein LTR77_008582 [Saxophila tyrrhenica]|uniref:Integral membrane protein n=1 Tax=Saxophila tyrrhenica TaxID=1690608 RepID=A0AAV9P1E2_9PEZI|nr:hypothetical protein LTR77_008582 [Saxophila tyrrhenica]